MREARITATVQLVVEYEENVDLVKVIGTSLFGTRIFAEGVTVTDMELKNYQIVGGLPIKESGPANDRDQEVLSILKILKSDPRQDSTPEMMAVWRIVKLYQKELDV